jgi:hypothetical protein
MGVLVASLHCLLVVEAVVELINLKVQPITLARMVNLQTEVEAVLLLEAQLVQVTEQEEMVVLVPLLVSTAQEEVVGILQME